MIIKHSTKLNLLTVPLLLLLFSSTACLFKASKPDLPSIFPSSQTARSTGKPPLIIIPGILGSELIHGKTRERLWTELFLKNRASLQLPISSSDFAENRDDVVASRVIESAQLIRFLPELGVYGALLEVLEKQGGYRRGNFEEPAADGDRDTFYLFAYDWRRDHVETARLMARTV